MFLLQFFGMFVNLLLMVTVVSDLYKRMDEVADQAEDLALEQPTLRGRYIFLQCVPI